MDHLKRLADILEISAASLVSDDPDYAHNGEERLLLQLARELDATQRQAVLAILKSMHGGNTGKP